MLDDAPISASHFPCMHGLRGLTEILISKAGGGGDAERNFWVKSRCAVLNARWPERTAWKESAICTKTWNNSVLQLAEVGGPCPCYAHFGLRDHRHNCSEPCGLLQMTWFLKLKRVGLRRTVRNTQMMALPSWHLFGKTHGAPSLQSAISG